MSTSKEYIKFKKNNFEHLSKLKKQKHNFEPTYYQVIAKNIKDDNQYETLFHKLSKKTNKS